MRTLLRAPLVIAGALALLALGATASLLLIFSLTLIDSIAR